MLTCGESCPDAQAELHRAGAGLSGPWVLRPVTGIGILSKKRMLEPRRSSINISPAALSGGLASSLNGCGSNVEPEGLWGQF